MATPSSETIDAALAGFFDSLPNVADLSGSPVTVPPGPDANPRIPPKLMEASVAPPVYTSDQQWLCQATNSSIQLGEVWTGLVLLPPAPLRLIKSHPVIGLMFAQKGTIGVSPTAIDKLDLCLVATLIDVDRPSSNIGDVVNILGITLCPHESDGSYKIPMVFRKRARLLLTLVLHVARSREPICCLLNDFSIPFPEPLSPPPPSPSSSSKKRSAPSSTSQDPLPPGFFEWTKQGRQLYTSLIYCGIAAPHVIPYIRSMDQQAVTLDMIGTLTDENLRECGIGRVGDRVRIRRGWALALTRAIQNVP